QRIAAHDEAAERMAHEYQRRLNAGTLEHFVQLGGDNGRGACGASAAAPAQACAVVGNGGGGTRDSLLNVPPVEAGGTNAGFENHCRAPRALPADEDSGAISKNETASGLCEAEPAK